MIIVPQNNDHQPGTWKGLQTDRGMSASFTCPNGHIGTLLDHEILEDGSVHPSVLCMGEHCGFHEFIRLEGWPPENLDKIGR